MLTPKRQQRHCKQHQQEKQNKRNRRSYCRRGKGRGNYSINTTRNVILMLCLIFNVDLDYQLIRKRAHSEKALEQWLRG